MNKYSKMQSHGVVAAAYIVRQGPLAGASKGLISGVLLAILLGLAVKAHAQSISSGSSLWSSKTCSGCHSLSAGDARVNAADPSSTSAAGSGIIARAIANNAVTGMGGISTTDTERRSIAMYIESIVNVTPISVSVSYNTAKVQNLGNYVVMNSSATDLDVLETGTSASKGSVTYSVATPSFTYTPTSGQCGSDSFTYRARDTGGLNHATGYRTVNITIANPGVPNITSSASSVAATFGSFMSWSPVNLGTTPRAYALTSGVLPAGLSFSTTSGVISGTPTDASDDTSVTVTAYTCLNGSLTGQSSSKVVSISIAKASQSISWGAQASQTYSAGGTFSISPTATASSGLSVTYSSATTSVCTVSGTTVTKVAAGTCTLNANQAGNTNYAAATQVQRSLTISKAAQSITFGAQTTPRTYSLGGTFAISPTATASSGLTVSYGSDDTAVCTVSGTTVTMVAAGTCPITANQAGNTNYNAAIEVVRNVVINATVPGAPTGVGASAGDTSAQVSFAAPANTGGTTITGYTVTCVPSAGGNRTATGAASPLTVTGMTNSTQYSCSVTATNSVGTGAASSSVNVTPMDTPVAPTFTSANATSFTVLNAGSFSVTASGVPAPTFTVFSGTLPSGVTLSLDGSLAGTPATGTAGSYPITLRAQNSAGTVNQSFTLTVAKRSQSISFPTPAGQSFGTGTVSLAATATSGLSVTFSSNTLSVCTVSGTSVTMVSVGECSITANQAGNSDYLAATGVTRLFDIAQGAQTVTFPVQTSPRGYPNGGTFSISPVATASSGLAVAYSSNTPAVCTVTGTTVTVLAIGDCTIEAEQAGNANYMAAEPVTRTVTIQKASQSITFAGTQPAQNYSSGGTFSLSPLGSASSGLAVAYSSLTADVCGIDEQVVNILTTGICTIAANQDGNELYNAAPQVTRNITINAVVPDAPTIGEASPANGSAAISFTPPIENGGAAITSYTVTCNPGNVTGSGAASPVVVSGLANNTQYACSVAAVNSAGTGASSATVNVTPFSQTGAQLWASVCTACHSAVPEGIQRNGAGTTATVLSHVRANQESMQVTTAVQALSSADLALIAQYIADNTPAIVVTTPPNTAKTISVASHVTLSGSVAFNAVEVVTPPTSGSLGAWFGGGRSITYTPTNGFTGTDSFTYRARHTGTGLLGDPRTVTINVTSSTATLTVAPNPAGLGEGIVNSTPFGVFDCYQAGGEIASGVCNNVLFPLNTSITLTAEAFEGSVFAGWTGVACEGGNSGLICIFTLAGNTSVTARFEPDVSAALSRYDFNDDGKSDILYRNDETGALYQFRMDGFGILAQSLIHLESNLDWKVIGQGDYNGDGKADLLWRNDVTGAVYLMQMDGFNRVAEQFIHFEANLAWKIIASADFDGDGKADILYRNDQTGALYQFKMDGFTIAAQALIHIESNLDWLVVGTGDYNGDGRADILWRNQVTGAVYLMLMNGFTRTSEQFIHFEPNLAWKIVGSADFDGDGKSDILYRNDLTGDLYQFKMDGFVISSQGLMHTESDLNWLVVTQGDYNGDGKADLLWRNAATGAVYLMQISGFTRTAEQFIYFEPNLAWKILGTN